MGWLGDVAGALTGGIVSGLFGMSNARDAQNRQADQNAAAMRLQHQFNVDDYQHRYQWSVDDMRAAGLNPILAATNGIGGNVNGTGLASSSAVMAPTPDMSSAFNSANQISVQRELGKMQNQVALKGLQLEETKISNAKEKQDNDIRIDNMMADVKKWSIEEENKRAWLMNDAQIQNLKETLRIQEEHLIRADEASMLSAEAHLASAEAAWASAQVQSRLADVAEKTGFTQQELNTAHKILMDIQARDAAAIAEWHEYLNKHPHIRGAVGFVSSFLDVAGMAYKTSGYGKTFTNGIQSGW